MTKLESIKKYLESYDTINDSELFRVVSESASDIMFSCRSIEEFTLKASKTPGIENVPELLDKINRISFDMGYNYEFDVTIWGNLNKPNVSLSMYITDSNERKSEEYINFDFEDIKVKINRYREVSKLLDL